MEYRIAKDDIEPPMFWVEKLVDCAWQRVFGTMEHTAGDAWAKLQENEANHG